jgi:hypothetical protein
MTELSPREPVGAATVPEASGVADYNAFISGLELQQIRLGAAEIDAPRPPEQRRIVPVVQLDDAAYTNDDGHISVRQTLRLDGTYEGESDATLRIRATYEVRYTANTPMTDAIFAEFRYRNLPVNVWPYFREYLQSTLCRVGWPVLTLPAFKRAPGPAPTVSDEVQGGHE